MTAELLASTLAVILSLLFSSVPGVKDWYDALDGTTKRLVMAAGLLLVAAGSFGLACASLAGDFGLALTCDKPGLIGLVQSFVAALVANQATYLLTVRKGG